MKIGLVLLFAISAEAVAWSPSHARWHEDAQARGVANSGASFAVAFADVNGDEAPDMFVTNSGSENALYLNNGQGKFVERTPSCPELADKGSTRGAVFGDVNGDGILDLYTTDSSAANHLYLGMDTCFKDATAMAGVGDTGMGQGACLGDVDGDGDLDLFVANFKQSNVFYLNMGNGTFRDATTTAGLTSASPFGGFGCAFGDVNGDGHLDLYVHNSGTHSKLYMNDGKAVPRGTVFFTDNTTAAGVEAGTGQGRAVVLADIDNDDDLDIYMVSAVSANQLYINDGQGGFKDGCEQSGVCDSGPAQGMQVADVDGDGDLDILVTQILSPSILYQNDGTGKFKDVAASSGADYHLFGQGAAFADIDGDGDQDMYVDTYGTPPLAKPPQDNRLLINIWNAPSNNAWLKVRPLNPKGHQTVLGASVLVRTSNNDTHVPQHFGVRVIDGGGAFASQNEYGAFFGLRAAAGVKMFDVEVRCPGGAWVKVTPPGGVAANQIITPRLNATHLIAY